MKAINQIPKAIASEKLILGLLISAGNKVRSKIEEEIKPNDFWDLTHREIYKKALKLDAINLLTVKEATSVSPSYLAELFTLPFTETEIEKYIEPIKKASSLRKLIHTGAKIQELGLKENSSLKDIIEETDKLLGKIELDKKSRVKKMDTLLMEAVQRFEDRANNKRSIGLQSGFKKLDNLLHGFRKGSLNIIAARPSIGKTSFAMDIARSVSKKKGSVVIFSLEQSSEEMIDKFICQEANISLWAMQSGRINDQMSEDYAKTVGEVSERKVIIDDSSSITANHIKATLMRIQNEEDVDLVIVDYLGLMRAGRKTNSIVEEVTYISGALKAIAKEFQIPVIALAQLNRSVEVRGDKIPKLSDLRDSGSIEQDADVVMFLNRDKKMDVDMDEAQLIIAKHRAGPIGVVDLVFDTKITSFRSKTTGYDL